MVLLLQSNANDDFLTLVIFQHASLWFNTCNFPKTEVGSEKFRAPVQTLENLEMKKTLIAIAALAATSAFAQSSVTLSGTVDTSVVNVNRIAGAASTSGTSLADSQSGTSALIFSGAEDLGGGTKANFLYEFNFSTVQTGSIASANDNAKEFQTGQVFVGLSGAMGDLKLGSPNSPDLTTTGSRQPFGTKAGGGYGSELGSGVVRRAGAFVYTTPSFSGLTASFSHAPKANEEASVNLTSANDAYDNFAVNYANGPLNVSASSLKSFAFEKNQIGANYTMGALKLMAGYGEEVVNKAGGTANTGTAATTIGTIFGATAVGDKFKNYNVAGVYALNAKVNLLANYAEAEKTAGTDNGKKGTITAIGAQYMFSKRTNAYARYVTQSWDKADREINTTLVGLQHNF
jgi:predicted porin